MKAAVFHGEHDVRVEEVSDPRPPGAGEVLVRPLWCGICGTDLHEYAMGPIVIPAEPHPLNGARLPQVLGHEFSAEVVEVGPDVTTVSAGQRVSIMPLLYCGACYYCRRGLHHLCVSMACVGLSYDWGGIAELAVVPASHVTALPDGVSDLQGALVEPTAVAAYGVDVAQVRPGDTVLVTGAGPIGALAALYAASLGARVAISEVNPVRAELARVYTKLAAAHFAASSSPGGKGSLSTARSYYQKGLNIWLDLRQLGALRGSDAQAPDQTAAELAKCEEMLQGGSKARQE